MFGVSSVKQLSVVSYFCFVFCSVFFLIFASFCSDPVIGSTPVGFGTCSTAKHRPSPFAGQWYPALLAVIVHPWWEQVYYYY
jgi:hypothetical protein